MISILPYEERNRFKIPMLNFINNNEIWAFYPRSINYLISSKGRVKNILTGKILKTNYTNQGYEKITLRFGSSKRFSTLVHRLVAQTFLPLYNSSFYEVNHINGNKADNSINNLEWMTRQENLQHARDTGLFKKQFGKSNGRYKHGKRCKGEKNVTNE